MIVSGLVKTSSIFWSVRYAPCLNTLGITSDVTHRLNLHADGNLLDSANEMTPDWLIRVNHHGLEFLK